MTVDKQDITWPQLLSLVEQHMGYSNSSSSYGLRKLHKIRPEHLHLDPSLRMRVSLAAQVLSTAVSKAFEVQGRHDTKAVAKFTHMFDTFFDWKRALKPYKCVDDWRFKWLLDDFLGYLKDWEDQCMAATNTSLQQKRRMCLSQQTLEGLRITEHMSLIEVKMASASPLKEIDDKFCLCSICLDQLKEPKLLPCLHRFCKDCLNALIQTSSDTFRCPECREEIQIPLNGDDGFKTDFYMKNLVEYVQIQQSLQSDEMRECYGCSNQLRVTAYCFKCNDFLCKDCHNFHVANKFLKEHQKHTLSLEDIESKNMTIEKLASIRDAPRCQSHPEKVSELYCETCNNLSVCMACMLGEHKGHDLHEVKTLAKSKENS